LRRAVSAGPWEIRPAHGVMALIHAAFLLATYLLLVRRYGRHPSTLLAFSVAVPTFLFFSYAPFLSHDLFPGAMLLAMLFLARRFEKRPGAGIWLALAALGTAAALIKQTYGLFWVLVLVSTAVSLAVERDFSRKKIKAFLLLGAGAAVSGAATWLVMAWVLSEPFSGLPFLRRPVAMVSFVGYIVKNAGAFDFSNLVYAKNAWAYGLAALALAGPGLVLSLSRPGLSRRVALAWILAISAMVASPFSEVRYLAFLAPLTAFLAVPAARTAWKKPVWLVPVLLLFAVDLFLVLPEGARIVRPFYTNPPHKAFLAPVLENPEAPVAVDWDMLSFFPDQESPLAGEPYHRLFHFGWHHLTAILGVDEDRILHVHNRPVLHPETVRELEMSFLGDRPGLLIHASALARNPAIGQPPPAWRKNLLEGVYQDRPLVLTREPEGGYAGGDGIRARFETGQDGRIFLAFASPPWSPERVLAAFLVDPEAGRRYTLKPEGDLRFLVAGAGEGDELSAGGRWIVRGLAAVSIYTGGARLR
ncbi:MAG: hypothetical protein ABIJ95_00435, partial [Pseudomonadota bacterium]